MLKKLIRHKQKRGGVSYSQAASIPVSNVAEPAAPKPATITTTPAISKGRNLDLRVLHVPQPPCQNVVDIVFVHGVTGNAYDTWRHHGSGTHWPSNLLQNDIPNARIMAWGYDADVVSFWGHAGRNRLGEHAKNLMGDVVRLREDTDTVGQLWLFPRSATPLTGAGSSKYFLRLPQSRRIGRSESPVRLSRPSRTSPSTARILHCRHNIPWNPA